MDLKQSLEFNNFLVLGDTTKKEKYAYKIKSSILRADKNCFCVREDGNSIDDCPFEIDVLDLCINPIRGLEYLKSTKKKFKYVVIQPGASSDDIEKYLSDNKIEFVNGGLLMAFKVYKGIEVEEND